MHESVARVEELIPCGTGSLTDRPQTCSSWDRCCSFILAGRVLSFVAWRSGKPYAYVAGVSYIFYVMLVVMF